MDKNSKKQASFDVVGGDDSWLIKILAFAFAVFILGLIVAGWLNRAESPLSAKDGQGYYLGMIGGSMMLLILLYPMRKHLKFMHGAGPIKLWYRTHLIIGLIAPTLILFHANFLYGNEYRSISTNGQVVFYAMLVVIFSGIIGRFFYRQVHSTLTQQHYTLDEMREEVTKQREAISHKIQLSDAQIAMIARFEVYIKRKSGFWSHMLALPFIRFKAKKMSRVLKKTIWKQISRSPKMKTMTRHCKLALYRDFKVSIDNYFTVMRQTGNFAFYERLFSIWYLFHFPLFILLFFSGILHVVVVHAY